MAGGRPQRRFEGGFVEQALGAGEPVRCRRRLHPILLVPAIILVVPLGLMPVWPSTILLGIAFAGLVIGSFVVFTLSTSEIAVTDRRILAQVHSQCLIIQINHVVEARARMSWFARTVGFGTLQVDLRLPRTDRLTIRGIADPAPLAKAINDSRASFSRESSDFPRAASDDLPGPAGDDGPEPPG